MRIMAGLIRANRPASEVMAIVAGEQRHLKAKFASREKRSLSVREWNEIQEVPRELGLFRSYTL